VPKPTEIAALAALLLAASAIAQDTQNEQAAEIATEAAGPPAPGTYFSLSGIFEHRFASEAADGLGDVSRTSVGADLSVLFSYEGGSSLALSLSDRTSEYNWTSPGVGLASGSGDPFNTIRTNALGGRYVHAIDRTFQPYVAGRITTSRAAGAPIEDSFTYAALAGTRINLHETFNFTLGGGFTTRLEGDPIFVPGFGITWKPTPRLTIGTDALPSGGSLGGGGGISYTFSDAWTAGFSVSFERDAFRLDKGRDPISEGVVRAHGLSLRWTARWTPSPDWTIDGTISYITDREMQFLDRTGRETLDLTPDPTLGLGFYAEYRF